MLRLLLLLLLRVLPQGRAKQGIRVLGLILTLGLAKAAKCTGLWLLLLLGLLLIVAEEASLGLRSALPKE